MPRVPRFRKRVSPARPPDGGFTVIEVIVAMGLLAVLMTLSAAALRSLWFAESLEGARDALVTELRKQQEDSVSQSHPLVFGVGLTDGAEGMVTYRFNPLDDLCTATVADFDAGLFNAIVRVESLTITNDTTAQEYIKCQAASPSDRIIFFYARGTSNGGSVVLEQPNTGRQRAVTVSAITGRVTGT